jgi:hypothetical protein
MFYRKKLTILLLIILFFLIIGGCDLFNGPKVDLYKAISDEVDWAHTPKLNVRIEYPVAWGTSVPVQGDITPARDLRKGYEFSVDFTPNGLYSLISWQVYYTSELGQIGNWLEDPSLLTRLIDEQRIESLGLNDVTPPDITADNARGGTYKFTIHTTEPVTIIPWCDPQLRITRTEPRHRPDGPPYSRVSDIVLYFNGALNEKTIKFANFKDDDGIWITAKSGGSVISNYTEKWFSAFEYAAVGGFFTITMYSGAILPPEDSLMAVTVKGIESAQGHPMDKDGYTFSWITSKKSDIKLISYNAFYNENDKNIVVTHNQTGNASVKMLYRQNREANVEFNGTIENVHSLNDSGVRNGVSVNGIMEYEITIELYVDKAIVERESFKIWNFSGMSVSWNKDPITDVITHNKAIEIKTAAELAGMKDNLSGHYVLENDITVDNIWTPVGAFNAPPGFDMENVDPETLDLDGLGVFHGKFYGNGHTITLKGGIIGGSLQGLFGCIYKSVIRDFTLAYTGSSPVTVSAHPVFEGGFCGGVAGYIKDSTVNNIITSGGGTLSVTASGDGEVSLGGIAGIIDDSFIKNCFAGLNVELIRSGGIGNVGGLAGYTNKGSGGNIPIIIKSPGANDGTGYNLVIDNVTVTAKVTGNTSGKTLNIGGAVGGSSFSSMRDIVVTGGKVEFDRTYITEETRAGGVTGFAENSNMETCSFDGNAFGGSNDINGKIDNLNKKYVIIGGLIGRCDTKNGKVYINNCVVRGNIRIEETQNVNNFDSGICIGGVLGMSEFVKGADKVYITNCFFEDGNIKAVCSYGDNQAGGFCGSFYEEVPPSFPPSPPNKPTKDSHYLNNCGVRAGTVEIEVKEYGRYIYAGGFTSQIWLGGTTSNCYSRANVISRASGNNKVEDVDEWSYTHQTGGFTGSLAPGATLSSCYATGTVQSEHNGNRELAVGGLVGKSGGIIENCYALGNVLADKTAGTDMNSNAGGLVGITWNEDGTENSGVVQYSFSAGQVIAKSAQSEIYVGGVVGCAWGESLSNTAALGAGVTVMGGSTKWHVGRIAPAYNNGDKNYALNSMTVEKGEYDSLTLTPVPLVTGSDKRDGEDTASSTFLSQAFWKNKLKFNLDENDAVAVDIWNFSRVAIEGYPRLALELGSK